MSDAFPWRDQITPHPAADLFPMMSDDELDELGQDILKNGLRQPIVVCRTSAKQNRPLMLLDGRNRLEAVARSAWPLAKKKKWIRQALVGSHQADYEDDPYTYVISANIRRRHLSSEQKRELIDRLLAADPSKSDRQIAKLARADHKTVGKVRSEKQATGEIPQLEKRTGADGKTRKQPEPRQPAAVATPVDPTERLAPRIDKPEFLATCEKLQLFLDAVTDEMLIAGQLGLYSPAKKLWEIHLTEEVEPPILALRDAFNQIEPGSRMRIWGKVINPRLRMVEVKSDIAKWLNAEQRSQLLYWLADRVAEDETAATVARSSIPWQSLRDKRQAVTLTGCA